MGKTFLEFFWRKLHFFKVSRSYECLNFPGASMIRLNENVTMEQCIRSCASIFNGLDIRVINDGFKKTKIEKFQSEETLQIDISRDEQLMNVIERMEKFRCDDSDDE